MESPPSTSTWSEPFILSDDSGLLLTSGSSGSISGGGGCGLYALDLDDSDCDDKCLSQTNSLDGMSDIMCGENFNTLKKGNHWINAECRPAEEAIDPPLEFQDKPLHYEHLAERLLKEIIQEGIRTHCRSFSNKKASKGLELPLQSYWPSELIQFNNSPTTRRSLTSSRLSSSHNSLSIPSTQKVDDSSFITQAVSHDTLTGGQINDIYNVPFDSDIYAVPADVVKPQLRPKRNVQQKRRRRYTSSCCHELNNHNRRAQHVGISRDCYANCNRVTELDVKRHSVAGSSAHTTGEPIHMTLQEVRNYLQTLYSSSSDSSLYNKKKELRCRDSLIISNSDTNKNYADSKVIITSSATRNNNLYTFRAPYKFKKNTFLVNIRNKRVKDLSDTRKEQASVQSIKTKKATARMFSLKQTLCNIFGFKKFISSDSKMAAKQYRENIVLVDKENQNSITNRALPPLPSKPTEKGGEQGLDFTTSIQKVKDYGWYWGPISSEAAEKILSSEPDGSFIVRDSSDDHYIFSLTFKLNNSVRHVRIEHDQGNFSFGSCTKFKSQTIVEFIENAVEHSRSGRYLFFLHRRPVIGPVRVQLLHPVSRFKQVQSLQHMCRFVILKSVRRDLLENLPLPRRMIDYLNTPHYYSEHLSDTSDDPDEKENNKERDTNLTSVYATSQNISSNVVTRAPIGNDSTVAANHNVVIPVVDNNIRQS